MLNTTKTGILLEAGTNELEIVEFVIGEILYGINVAKVKEILRADVDIVSVPDVNPFIEGVINLRGSILPVINLAKYLKIDTVFNHKLNRIIIIEFNGMVIGFLVTAVSRIHRISAKDLEPPSVLFHSEQCYITAIIKIKENVVFLIDVEKITFDINPRAYLASLHPDEYTASSAAERKGKKILVVEDSEFMRNMIVEHLQLAGYRTEMAVNGQEAWERLTKLKSLPGFEKVEQFFHLMVADIEMPQIDGMHLVKLIKADAVLRRLPCVAFSSMISKELVFKCRQVGFDAEIAKPEISQLVAMVDSKVLPCVNVTDRNDAHDR